MALPTSAQRAAVALRPGATITVADAYAAPHGALYSTRRGNRVVSIEQRGTWYVVSFASGGKRHVRGDHLLWKARE